MQRLPSEVTKHLDAVYFDQLANRHAPNPKLAVFFSGGNAVGKSTLAQKLAIKLQALVLENDAIREAVSTTYQELSINERNQCMWQYSLSLYQRLESMTPNGFVVRDATIDRYYDEIFPIFEKQGYEIFVIGFEVGREKRIELIKQRGDKKTIPVDRLIDIVDRYEEPIIHFRTQRKVDLMISEVNLFDHDSVVEVLQEKLQQLQS